MGVSPTLSWSEESLAWRNGKTGILLWFVHIVNWQFVCIRVDVFMLNFGA